MTKRFTLTNPKNAFQEMKCGIDDRGNTLTFNEVVDMLNAFNEENEQLRKDATTLIYSNQDYRKENEQLKRELKRLDDLWGEKCVREYLTVCGESILKEMHDEKYGDKK